MAPPPSGVTPATTSPTTAEVAVDLDEKPAAMEGNDNINSSTIDVTDDNAATATDTNVISSSETEQLERNVKKDEDASTTGENDDQENIPMDTSETENMNLVNNSNSNNSLSDGSQTKDDKLDTTNNNNSKKCRNSDSSQ